MTRGEAGRLGGKAKAAGMPPGYLTVAQGLVMAKLAERNVGTIRTSGKTWGPRILDAIEQLCRRRKIKVIERSAGEVTYSRFFENY